MAALGPLVELLEFLNNLSPDSAADPAVVELHLQGRRDQFVQLLDYKALLLSDELKLDEIYCIELLIAANEERGSYSVETAAGIYFEERQACVKCLLALLADVATGMMQPQEEVPRHPYVDIFHDFVVGLLSERVDDAAAKQPSGMGQMPSQQQQQQQGSQKLLSRIVQVLKDNPLEPRSSSQLQEVKDEAGIPISRALMLQIERRLLCKCLLYATFIDQRAAPAVVAGMLELLDSFTSKARGTGHGDVFLQEQLQLVLLSCALALIPQEERGAQERQQLQALATSDAVKAKIGPASGSNATLDSFAAMLHLAWGVLLASAQQPHEEARKHLMDAVSSGAFHALRQMFSTAYFKMDDSLHQELVACAVYRLLGLFLLTDHNLGGSISKAMLDRCMAPLKRTGQHIAYVPVAPEDPLFKMDHNGTLLGVLASVFGVHPRLWLSPDLPYAGEARGHVEGLISRTVMHDVMKMSPEVRVPFLEMMTALTVGEYGATMVLRQFAEMSRTPSLESLSWKKLITAIVEYCVRYNMVLAEAGRGGGGPGGALAVPIREERLMNMHEAEILVAFLGLLRQIIEQGSAQEVRGFLESQERDLAPLLSNYPLYEPFFQLMCHPVPNTVKAALDEVLAAMARFKDYAPRLLERLMQCTAVTPGTPNVPGVPRLDLVTQINEIEARKEEYPETIAFTCLLNALVAAVKDSRTDGGQELQHFTAFIMQHVLAHLRQRGYRQPNQKWEIAAVAFQHLELMLELAARCSSPPADVAAKQAPGFMVMHDILGGGLAMQALQHILLPGYEELAVIRTQAEAVTPREAAVVAGLRVLTAVMRLDMRFLAELTRVSGIERYQPFESQLRQTPNQLATLLEYVCYQDSIEIQIEAIRITAELASRLPSLVELLQQPNFDLTACINIRRGFALALSQSILSPAAVDNLDDAGDAGTNSMAEHPDPRAALILRLMLRCVMSPVAPSLTHLLMGYDVEPSMNGIEDSMLMPRAEYSCLTAIERALVFQSGGLSCLKSKLYSQCLCLLYRLAYAPASSPPMLDYLSPRNLDIQPILRAIATREMPPMEATHQVASALHQRSWILRLQALLLLQLEHPDDNKQLLQELFGLPLPAPEPVEDASQALVAAGSGTIGQSPLLEVLNLVSGLELREPSLLDIPAEERRLLQEMSVDDVSIEALLTQRHVMEAAGVLMVSDTGDALYDMAALYPLLMRRYEQYIARSGQMGSASEAPAAAVKNALAFLQQHNAYAMVVGAQRAAAEGWAQLVQVAFTRRYDLMAQVLMGSPAESLYETLLSSLQVMQRLLARGDAALGAVLCGVARILLSKLQEQAVVHISLGQPTDPLATVRKPTKCHELLRQLLELLQRSRQMQPVRVQLYAALLQYLQFSRGSKLGSCTPVVLEAVLEGWGTGAASSSSGYISSVARLDATQEAIEQGNASLINEQGALLVELLSKDALDQSAPQLQQAVALHLLAALVAHSPGGAAGVASAMYQQNLPQSILQLLTMLPQQVLLQPAKRSWRAVYVIEAQLALLLRLSEAGHPKQRQISAQQLYSLQALQYLNNCKAIDFEPEDPVTLTGHAFDSLRYRLHHVVTAVLRVTLSLVGSLPESTAVRADARLLVDGHYRLLDRLLREAASSGARDWAPAEQELEQADLAVALLSRLLPVWHEIHPMHAAGLRHALYRLTFAVCGLDSKSPSPFVRSLLGRAEGYGGVGPASTNKAALAKRAGRVVSLRCSIARFLQESITHARGDEDMLRCLGAGPRSEVDPQTAKPSLLLVRDMAEQACLDALGTLDELTGLLQLLRCPDTMLDDAITQAKLAEYGPATSASVAQAVAGDMPGGLPAKRRLARHFLALAASQLDSQLGKALFIIENTLSIILLHFLRYLPRTFPLTGAGPAAAGAGRQQANGHGSADDMQLEDGTTGLDLLNLPAPSEKDAEKLGSRSDIAYFISRLQETILKTEDLLSQAQAMSHHRLDGIDLSIRALKSYCSNY